MTRSIDFKGITGPVYVGRSRGEAIRSRLKIDEMDDGEDRVTVSIPGATLTVSSSFFLGMFGPSIIKLGNKDAFYRHYEIQAPAHLKSAIDRYVGFALLPKSEPLI
jgi:hypothetical protein